MSVTGKTEDYINPPTLVEGRHTMDIIGAINRWNKDAGRTDDQFNVRSVALHTGLQCEELAEKLRAMGMNGAAADLDTVGKELKKGYWDNCIQLEGDRLEMLDADCDLMVVTIGSAQAQGADLEGAMREVIRSNESKRQPDGTLAKDGNGKILKGPLYREPDLKPFMLKL